MASVQYIYNHLFQFHLCRRFLSQSLFHRIPKQKKTKTFDPNKQDTEIFHSFLLSRVL